MRISAGDTLLFKIEKGDKLSVYPLRTNSMRSLAGLLEDYARERPVTVEEMKKAVRDRAATKYKK